MLLAQRGGSVSTESTNTVHHFCSQNMPTLIADINKYMNKYAIKVVSTSGWYDGHLHHVIVVWQED
jgi:hypothetical protein